LAPAIPLAPVPPVPPAGPPPPLPPAPPSANAGSPAKVNAAASAMVVAAFVNAEQAKRLARRRFVKARRAAARTRCENAEPFVFMWSPTAQS
jgi:hypothetical protein